MSGISDIIAENPLALPTELLDCVNLFSNALDNIANLLGREIAFEEYSTTFCDL